jgi:hypothetical protein
VFTWCAQNNLNGAAHIIEIKLFEADFILLEFASNNLKNI